MKFQLIFGPTDQERYGDLVLDIDRLDDTDCETLMAWEEAADYSLHMLKLMTDTQPARWKRAVLWFALKQAGSDVAFADLKLNSVGAMWLKRIDKPGDVRPPDATSSEDESATAS